MPSFGAAFHSFLTFHSFPTLSTTIEELPLMGFQEASSMDQTHDRDQEDEFFWAPGTVKLEDRK